MRSVSILLLVALTAYATQAQPIPESLGFLPGGTFQSGATGVTPDGHVVVGVAMSANGMEAFRWTETGGMQGLGDLGGDDFNSVALDVSADGAVVVGMSRSGSGTEAFRWHAGTMQGLGFLTDHPYTEAYAVTGDGATVVGTASDGVASRRAFRWTVDGGIEELGSLPGGNEYSEANGISADGSVIVGDCISADGFEACRWVNESPPEGLGPSGSPLSRASGVSPDGSVVVGQCTLSGTLEACRWADGAWEVLGGIPGASHVESGAWASTDDGSIIMGWSYDVEFVIVPVLWIDGGEARYVEDVLVEEFGVDLAGWSNFEIGGVTGDGRVIVGTATNPSGETEAFRLFLNNGQGTPIETPGADMASLSFSVSPNPTTDFVTLKLEVPSSGAVRIEAFDLLGRRVALLHDGQLAAGEHALTLASTGLAPGPYVLRVTTPHGEVATRVLTVIR